MCIILCTVSTARANQGSLGTGQWQKESKQPPTSASFHCAQGYVPRASNGFLSDVTTGHWLSTCLLLAYFDRVRRHHRTLAEHMSTARLHRSTAIRLHHSMLARKCTRAVGNFQFVAVRFHQRTLAEWTFGMPWTVSCVAAHYFSDFAHPPCSSRRPRTASKAEVPCREGGVRMAFIAKSILTLITNACQATLSWCDVLGAVMLPP